MSLCNLAPPPDAIKSWAEILEHVAVIVASIIGGGWAMLRVFQERSFDSALTIDAKLSGSGTHPAFLEISLANVGKVKLQAKPSDRNAFAYNDGVERLKHSCSLQLKRLVPLAGIPDTRIDWFEDTKFVNPPLDEINLLNEYEDPHHNDRVDFWMEPGEVYHLGVPLALSAGVYLAKVTFIGARNDREFWSRIILVRV
jgi:hypothetical protein